VGASIAAIGRVIDSGLNFELLNGVGIGNGNAAAKEAAGLEVVDRQTVHEEIVVPGKRAMSAKTSLRFPAGASAQLGGIGNAGSDSRGERNDLGIVSGDGRQLASLGPIGNASEGAGTSLKQLRVSRNCYSFLDASCLQFNIKPSGFSHIDTKPALYCALKSSFGELDRVRPGREQRNYVVPAR